MDNKTKDWMPKDFIEDIFIRQYKEIISRDGKAYIGYALIAIGIEFLGKAIDTELKTWHPGNSQHFDHALDEIPSLKRYKNKRLRQLLRNGMAHSLAPQIGLNLSEIKNGTTHLDLDLNEYLVLNIESFFSDFLEACNYVIKMDFLPNDKMNKAFLRINN